MVVSLWQTCLGCLEQEFPAQQFNTWIRPLKAEAGDDSQLRLVAPNRFVMDWVSDKYLSRIRELVGEHGQEQVRGVVLEVAGTQPRAAMHRPATASLASAEPVALHQTKPASQLQREVRPAVAKSEVLQADTVEQVVEREIEVEGGIRHQTHLNSLFTFETFVQGKSNQLALAAAQQVAENPGSSYNPLFIYGGVGLGKTHLMHAVGAAMLQRNPNAKIVYLHSERFVADMVKALQLNAINEFKRYYRSVDALLIDDIQFFANKDRSQEEFFHTFNALLEGGQQMILTCDRYPKEIAGLEDRLKSRFGWGLTVAVEPPELETRGCDFDEKG